MSQYVRLTFAILGKREVPLLFFTFRYRDIHVVLRSPCVRLFGHDTRQEEAAARDEQNRKFNRGDHRPSLRGPPAVKVTRANTPAAPSAQGTQLNATVAAFPTASPPWYKPPSSSS